MTWQLLEQEYKSEEKNLILGKKILQLRWDTKLNHQLTRLKRGLQIFRKVR